MRGANIYSNDPKKNPAKVTIGVLIKVPILLSPRSVYLRGQAGQTVTKSLTVTAGLDKPLTLAPSQFDLDSKVTYLIEEVDRGKKYRISFNLMNRG